MADNARAKRLADLIREVVAEKLHRGIKDPRLGTHVTVTDTRVTGDLREATVFYTVYGDDEDRKAAAAISPAGRESVQNENSTHNGTLSPVSRLSRRINVPSAPSATR